MKFKAKETNKSQSTNEVWILKGKVYDLEKTDRDDEYFFRCEIGHMFYVLEKDLHKYFEAVEEAKKPRICEILGAEVNERFKLKTADEKIFLQEEYYISKNGYFLDEDNNATPNIGIDTINGNFIVVKLPKYTDEEKEIFKALKVLGYKYIARDKDVRLFAFNAKPYKQHNVWIKSNEDRLCDLKKDSFDFIEWEDKEPFEIPNI